MTAWKYSKQSGKFRKVWKVLGQSGKFRSGKFLDSLESFQTAWKVSNQSGNLKDIFWSVWKVFKQSGKFWKSLKSFSTVWKVSEKSGKFPAVSKNCCHVSHCKHGMNAKEIYALLVHLAIYASLSRKRFRRVIIC